MQPQQESFNQEIIFDNPFGIRLFVKREDVLHQEISGNKFRKLKYNLIQAKKQNHKTLLTFGGAYSNHIAAVAAAGRDFGFQTIGVIRGEELEGIYRSNPTLSKAEKDGMKLSFISRADYRKKNTRDFIDSLHQEFGDFYLLPEGGTNKWAVKGCEEILTPEDGCFDYICCAVGTGGTISGIINSSKNHQQTIGFPALKGNFLEEDILQWVTKNNWCFVHDYHFGGYAKVNETLNRFISEFESKYFIPLDPIYTAKMFFGVMDLIIKGDFFSGNAKILLIHTGGLQGKKSNIAG